MKQLINHISSLLEAAYPPDEAQALAWWIAEEETGLSRSQLLCGCKDTAFSSHMQTIVDRLLHFEPIQYIFGHTLWCGLDLKVTSATLIPRPETSELVEKIINHKFEIPNCRILDIGTGTGCIAIALQKAHPDWQVTGIDILEDAIAVAKENAKRNHVEVDFHVADIFDFNGDFDIVVSNPPYVCEREKASMRRNVLEYEPASAPDDVYQRKDR